MRVFACFLYFSSLKKNEIIQVCVRLFYSLHIQQWMRNHWKGQRTVAVIPFSDVGILNPKISCALLSHHLVNSCRLAHNFPAAWSMGSKENGLIQVPSLSRPWLYWTNIIKQRVTYRQTDTPHTLTYSDTHTNWHIPLSPPPFIPKLNKSPLPSRAFTSTYLLEILSLPFP